MNAASEAAQRARACVGAPFRLGGRDPEHGLDCIGLALFAYRLSHELAPRGYALGPSEAARWEAALARAFERKPAGEAWKKGDLLLADVGRSRLHLAIAGQGRVFHADAAKRRVLATALPPHWRVHSIWKIRS